MRTFALSFAFGVAVLATAHAKTITEEVTTEQCRVLTPPVAEQAGMASVVSAEAVQDEVDRNKRPSLCLAKMVDKNGATKTVGYYYTTDDSRRAPSELHWFVR